MSTIKKEHKVLKITDTLYSISKFLNYEDKSNLLSSSKTIFNKKKILTLNENKKAFIIIRFFRKAYYIFNKIKYIKLVDDVSHFRDKPTIATSRTMALYYFIYYEKKYIKPFLDLANKYNEGTPNFIDNIIENPSKYDLFKFQNSIPLHLILNIGW